MARLSYQQRKRLPKGSFAIPSKKDGGGAAGRGGYPIPDEAHARNALSRVSRFGTPEEKRRVRSAVRRRFPQIGKAREPKGEF